ncbi:MAG: alpha/beta hydrolase [Marinicaulis sp.]|nr:alpha/beta hydrolase [Marinicaulis sp.]
MLKDFPDRKFIDANGVRFAAHEVNGDPDGKNPPVMLVHGWPEIAYSWKNQIKAIADAGYRVVAFDLKGFGWSDKPREKERYDVEHLTADFAALLDALDINRAVFCGHDWGGSLVWSMGQLHPERVAGVIGVCTPLKPRAPAPPVAILKKRFTDKHYFVQFQEPDRVEKLFATDVNRFVRMMFQKPAPRERWASLVPWIFDLPGRFAEGKPVPDDKLIVSNDVIDAYRAGFEQSGFHGGVNLYRNIDRNWKYMEGRNEIVRAPSLWIGAELDLFLPPESADGMEALVPNLERRIIEGAGHWLTWERPNEMNALIIDWLNDKFSE